MSEHWWTADNHRVDQPALRVEQFQDGSWAILRGSTIVARECLCCGKPLATSEAAKAMCEAVFPPRSEA